MHTRARDVRAERRVRPREPVVVLIAPEPSDVGASLEALGVEALIPQCLQHREAGRARTDHGDVRNADHGGHADYASGAPGVRLPSHELGGATVRE
jgi:hypothetical protein